MGVEQIKKENIYLFLGFLVVALIGYFQFRQFADYTYLSERNYLDIIRSKTWVFLWILFSFYFIYKKRQSKFAHLYTIFVVSIYFIILYSILFRGTEYGLNGNWGDNSYRLPMIQKILNSGIPSDPFLKNLHSMYPPLWFYLNSLFAKIFHLEAYQTVKFGYYLIYLIYPWLLYFIWKKVSSSSRTAAILSVGVVFFANEYLNYIYYEHISLMIFIPWWLYYFENTNNVTLNWKFYVQSILIGSLLFMTYYWWFFIALIAFPIILYKNYSTHHSKVELFNEIKYKLFIAFGIMLVTTIYWVPLLIDVLENGYYSTQSQWFRLGYTDIYQYILGNYWHSIIIFSGVALLGYLWKKELFSKIAILYLCGFIVIILDRLSNLGFSSIQSRKFLEFLFHLMMIPTLLGVASIWKKITNTQIKRGIIFVFLVISFTVGDSQTQVYKDSKYQISINQRYPASDIKIMQSIDFKNKVFLTNHYIEASYLTYYMFVHLSNTAAHFAGNFYGRVEFLENVAQIEESELFVYTITNNIFDTIDYIYYCSF